MAIIKNKTWLSIMLLFLVLGAIYFLYDPAKNSFFPSCPFKEFTGLDCPGCGSQRAFHELLHLNFKKAFDYNALLILSIPYILLLIAFNFERIKKRFPKTEKFLFARKSVWAISGVVALFFIYRNI